jgi:hypothetical protein
MEFWVFDWAKGFNDLFTGDGHGWGSLLQNERQNMHD